MEGETERDEESNENEEENESEGLLLSLSSPFFPFFSFLSYEENRVRQEKMKKAREEKAREPDEETIHPSFPHRLPPSYLFLSVLCYSLFFAEMERRGGRKEERGGMSEPEMAKKGEWKDRGRLKRTTPPPNLAATSPLLLCLHTHPRKLVLVYHQCDRKEEQGMNRGGGQGPAAFLSSSSFHPLPSL